MTSPFMNTIHRLPIDIKKGNGAKLIDADGNEFLDFWGDEGVASLGYATPIIQSVFQDFAERKVPHRLPDAYPNDLRSRAAAALCRAARFDQAFFCNSGAEANEAAIKLARRYWSKVKGVRDRFGILTVEGNFHGRTGYALAASDSRDSMYHKDGYGPTPPGFGVIEDSLDITRIWHYSANERAKDGGDWRDVPPGDGHYWLSMGEHWSNVAAVIMAPILGNNTVKTYPRQFWERLAALREEHKFLLIFDEVQVATGRTGAFCAHHRPDVTWGVRPDIVCIGKGIAAGLPAAMILADEDVASAFVPGVHFSTFGASMIVCQMMLEVIGWLERNHGHIWRCESYMVQQFNELKADGLISAFDGAGIHWGFTPNWENIGADGPTVVDRARDFGLLMLTHRKLAPIRFTPPLNVTSGDLESAFQRLRQTLASFRHV